jgi:hypothetical protein
VKKLSCETFVLVRLKGEEEEDEEGEEEEEEEEAKE